MAACLEAPFDFFCNEWLQFCTISLLRGDTHRAPLHFVQGGRPGNYAIGQMDRNRIFESFHHIAISHLWHSLCRCSRRYRLNADSAVIYEFFVAATMAKNPHDSHRNGY